MELLWPVVSHSQTVFLNVWIKICRITKGSNYIELKFSNYFTYGHGNVCLYYLKCCIVMSSGASNYCDFKVVVRVVAFEGQGRSRQGLTLKPMPVLNSWKASPAQLPELRACTTTASCHPICQTWNSCNMIEGTVVSFVGGVDLAYGCEVTPTSIHTICMYVGDTFAHTAMPSREHTC